MGLLERVSGRRIVKSSEYEKNQENIKAINSLLVSKNPFDNPLVTKEDAENTRPALDYLHQISGSGGVKLPVYPIPPQTLYEMVEYSDILRNIFAALKQEIFRNGFNVEPKFTLKCTNEKCGKEFDEEQEDEKCDRCGAALREPDIEQEKILKALIENKLNENGHSLKDILREMEDDTNCYDKETEILTELGWKFFKDLLKTDRVATLNPSTWELEYQYPLKLVKSKSEKMISIDTKSVNLMVTPNHYLYAKKERDKEFSRQQARDIFGMQMEMKRDCIWNGKKQDVFTLPELNLKWYSGRKVNALQTLHKPEIKIPMKDWMAFFGLYVSEGNIQSRYGKNYNRVRIGQKDKIDTVRKIIAKLPFETSEYKAKTGVTEIMIDSTQLAKYLSNFGNKCYNKFIPRELLELSPELLKILFNSLMFGDGCQGKGYKVYITTSKRLADDVQEIALKIGYSANIKKNNLKGTHHIIRGRKITRRRDEYRVQIYLRKNTPYITKKYTKWSYVDYNDKVYCCVVPNHIIYVRRRGAPVWCGNTIDDCYLILVKEYTFNEAGEIDGSKIKEILRGNPLFIRMIADRTGRPGRDNDGDVMVTCPIHRENRQKESIGTICPECGKRMYKTDFVAHPMGVAVMGAMEPKRRTHYIEGEIIHGSRYMPSLTYGFPLTLACYQKVITLMNMDRYIKKYYEKMRAPRGLLLINSRNAESLKKAWDWLIKKTIKNPHIPHPLAVESDSQRGQVAQWINLMEPLSDMQYVESRNEFRRVIGACYGIMPLFTADTSTTGGLGNEGLEITVTNRAAKNGQDTPYHERIFPFLLEQYGITDWKLELNPSEEKDEMAEMQREAQNINNALAMRNLGFEVKMDYNGEFSYKKIEYPEGEPPPVGGMMPEVPQVGARPEPMPKPQRFTGEPESVRRAYKLASFELGKEFGSLTTETPGVYNPVHDGRKRPKDRFNTMKLGIDGVMKEFANRKIPIFVTKQDEDELIERIKHAIFSRKFLPYGKTLSKAQSDRIKAILIKAFDQDWGIREIIKEIRKVAKRIPESALERIIRTEQTSITNTAREFAYSKAPGIETHKFRWLGPSDDRVTIQCKEIKSRTIKGVSLEKLKEIVNEVAVKYDKNFQVRDYNPHFMCRHTFVRVFD